MAVSKMAVKKSKPIEKERYESVITSPMDYIKGGNADSDKAWDESTKYKMIRKSSNAGSNSGYSDKDIEKDTQTYRMNQLGDKRKGSIPTKKQK